MHGSAQQFSKTALVLHWLVAITIISLMVVGIYMHENDVNELYPIHKSIGIIIFAFILMRVVWRIKEGWPVPVGNYSNIEHILAKLVHWVLLIGSVLFPLSGMMMSGAGGHGLSVFGFELLAANYSEAGKAIALNPEVAEIGKNMHGLLANVFIAAILLHVVGAIKHHFVDKDGTLRRILGMRI